MKYYGVEIPDEVISWLFWYVKIGTAAMVAERRLAERIAKENRLWKV